MCSLFVIVVWYYGDVVYYTEKIANDTLRHRVYNERAGLQSTATGPLSIECPASVWAEVGRIVALWRVMIEPPTGDFHLHLRNKKQGQVDDVSFVLP